MSLLGLLEQAAKTSGVNTSIVSPTGNFTASNGGGGSGGDGGRAQSSGGSSSNRSGCFEPNFLWCITELIGRHVEVYTRDGTVFNGVLYSVHPSEKHGLDVLLQCVTVRPQESTPDAIVEKPIQVLRVPHTEFVQIVARGVTFASASASSASAVRQSTNYGVLQTDREIGALHRSTAGQDLVPWCPSEPAGSSEDENMSLDDFRSEGWDQIAANREMFGVHCSYDEEIYTTHLDKEAPEYEERNARAAIIAREIESEGSTNIHILEERGKAVTGDYSEEALYSAATHIKRERTYQRKQSPNTSPAPLSSPSSSSGAYVPPHLRGQASSPKPSPQAYITPASPKSSKPIVEVSTLYIYNVLKCVFIYYLFLFICLV